MTSTMTTNYIPLNCSKVYFNYINTNKAALIRIVFRFFFVLEIVTENKLIKTLWQLAVA